MGIGEEESVEIYTRHKKVKGLESKDWVCVEKRKWWWLCSFSSISLIIQKPSFMFFSNTFRRSSRDHHFGESIWLASYLKQKLKWRCNIYMWFETFLRCLVVDQNDERNHTKPELRRFSIGGVHSLHFIFESIHSPFKFRSKPNYTFTLKHTHGIIEYSKAHKQQSTLQIHTHLNTHLHRIVQSVVKKGEREGRGEGPFPSRQPFKSIALHSFFRFSFSTLTLIAFHAFPLYFPTHVIRNRLLLNVLSMIYILNVPGTSEGQIELNW